MRHVWTGEMCGIFSFLWSVSGWVPRHRIHAPYRKVSQRKSNHSITVIKSTWCWKLKPKHTCHTKINIWESKIISNTSSGRMRSPKATRVSSKHFRQTLSHTQRWSCEIESTNKLASSNIHCLPNKKTIQKAKLSQGLHIGELVFSSQEDIWVRCFPTHRACECPTCVPRDPRPMQIAWHPPELPVLGLAVVLPSKHWRRCGPSRCWCFLTSKIGFVFIVIQFWGGWASN